MTDARPRADAPSTARTSVVDGTAPEPPTAPAVVAVVVTRDPGPWFEEVLASLRDQTYKQLSVLIVDAASEVDPSPRIAAVLPRARIRRLDRNSGFGAAANEVLDLVEGAAFHLLCHDDVALEPDAVRNLVEEAFRTNAGVLGPKLVDWQDSRRIRSVGGSVDKVGVPAPFAEPGELDQEQHDGIRDVFYVAGGATLVRADLFATLGGFDRDITYHGDDIDLCWRAHVAGARVVIVPAAVGRHLEALGERRTRDDRRHLQQRHRVRTLLSSYRMLTLVRVVPQALVLSTVEAVVALAGGRFRHVGDIVGAWTWNLRHPGAIMRRRRALARARIVGDTEVRDLQVRGSARLTAFLRGQLSSGDDRLAALASTGRELSGALRGPLTRLTVGAAVVALAVMAVGTRNLISQPLPAVGEMAAFPDGSLDLLGNHLSGWRTTGGGGEGPSPTGVGAFGLTSLLAMGSTGVARKILILALLPAGPLAAWRLTRPIGSIRAAAAAVVVYAAIPLPYNALSGGSWSALATYATVPWIVLGLARAMRLAPYGPVDLPAEAADAPGPSLTSLPARILGLGLAVGLAAIVTPAIVIVTALVVAGLLVGSLVAGRPAGVVRLVVAGIGGVAVAGVLHLPWSASLVGAGDWSSLLVAEETRIRPFGQLLRFQTGPFGDTPLSWAFLAAAALPLVIGRGWRLAWAVRGWFVALAGWGPLFATDQGWLDLDLPPTEVLLVPAAVGLALSAAMGVAAFEVDLRQYRFGWRQGATIAAAVAVVVGSVTLLPGVVGGRWEVPRSSLDRPLATVLDVGGDPEARLLWLGPPDLLPVGSHRYAGAVSLATSDGLPDVTDRWVGPRHEGVDRLSASIGLARERRTAHLGRLLAPEGVRYVVVPTRSVPAGSGGVERPPPSWLADALAAQADLEQVVTDSSLLVYRNLAWTGVAAEVPAGADLPSSPAGAVGLDGRGWRRLVTSTATDSYTLRSAPDGDVVAAVPADSGWELRADGRDLDASGQAFGWAARFEEPGDGRTTLAFDTDVAHTALAVGQPVLWLVVFGARVVVGRRARRQARDVKTADRASSSPAVDEDPVTAAATAVAGLAARTAAGSDGPGSDARRRGRRRRREKEEG